MDVLVAAVGVVVVDGFVVISFVVLCVSSPVRNPWPQEPQSPPPLLRHLVIAPLSMYLVVSCCAIGFLRNPNHGVVCSDGQFHRRKCGAQYFTNRLLLLTP